jgi:hypothetical protein
LCRGQQLLAAGLPGKTDSAAGRLGGGHIDLCYSSVGLESRAARKIVESVVAALRWCGDS